MECSETLKLLLVETCRSGDSRNLSRCPRGESTYQGTPVQPRPPLTLDVRPRDRGSQVSRSRERETWVCDPSLDLNPFLSPRFLLRLFWGTNLVPDRLETLFPRSLNYKNRNTHKTVSRHIGFTGGLRFSRLFGFLLCLFKSNSYLPVP